jgi:NCAIR mutase (PurE)-related protein
MNNEKEKRPGLRAWQHSIGMRRWMGLRAVLVTTRYLSKNLPGNKEGFIPGRVQEIGNFAKIDLDRAGRAGFPEVILAKGKSKEHLAAIFKGLHESASQDLVIATKVDEIQYDHLIKELGNRITYCSKSQIAHMSTLASSSAKPVNGSVAVLCAGTSDYFVAEEAAILLKLSGVTKITRLYDVGVAGLNRLLSQLPVIQTADVIIVCAGMDGALPSVVGGLTAAPVIAVPTSVGYGAAFGGVSSLLTMINSCSPGVTVVNIDNGFGAAVSAYKILRKIKCIPSDAKK